MHSIQQRKLGSIEQCWAIMDQFEPVIFVGVLRLSNGPPPHVLLEALNRLQSNEPLLRATITKRASGFYFEEHTPVPPSTLSIVARSDADAWRHIAETELATPINTARPPLARYTYIHGEKNSEFIFAMHHAIIDSQSGQRFIEQLLECCQASIQRREYALAPRDVLFQPPLEALFPAELTGFSRFKTLLPFVSRQIKAEIAYRRQLGNRQQQHTRTASNNRILELSLSIEATHALIRQTRKHRVTINSLLQAALLTSLRKYRYADGSAPMRGITFADMRPHVQPPIAADAMGVYISMMHYTLPPAADPELWVLASQIGDEISRSSKSDDKYLAAMVGKNLIRMLVLRHKERLGMVALSYIGPLTLASSYGTMQIRGLSGYVSNNILGPELVAFGKILDGRLSMDFLYLDADMDEPMAQQIINHIQQTLESVQDEESVT